MTVALSAEEVANKLNEQLPGSVIESYGSSLLAKSESLVEIASFLKAAPGLEFDYLSSITAIDYYDYYELAYILYSIKHNHSLTLKTRCYGRQSPSLPSVVNLWQGADYQEREIYDLLGIEFNGHPNLKHIVLWEGFAGHPLRKDYL